MIKKKIFVVSTFFCVVLVLFVGCAGRAPSPKTAQSMTQHYFKSYAKKYKTSVLGKNPVQKVEVNQVVERSRHLAEIDAFLNLSGGQVARVALTTKKLPPFGWSISSWELIDLR